MRRERHTQRCRLTIALVIIGAGCSSSPAPPGRPETLTDAERAALADTIGRLHRQTDAAVDSLSCAELLQPGSLPIAEPFNYVIEGMVIELTREQWPAACQRMKQGVRSARNEIYDQKVHVLGRDAGFVVSRSTYTIRWSDGRTTSGPRVTTTVWSRLAEGWRQVHLHESWPAQEAAGAETDSAVRTRR